MKQRATLLLAFGAAALFFGCNRSADPNAFSSTNLTSSDTPPVSVTKVDVPASSQSNVNNLLEPEVEFDIDKSTEHLIQGNTLLNEGKFRQAIEQFQLAIKYNPTDEDTFYNLAFAQTRAGDVQAAKDSYRKALDLYPDYVEAHNNLGNILVSEGNYAAAIDHFQKALENDDQNASSHNNIGTAYARQKKLAQSLAHFETAVQLKPDYPEAQYNLGNAYLFLGRVDEAIDVFTRLLQLHPEFQRAREQLQRAKAAKANSSAQRSK